MLLLGIGLALLALAVGLAVFLARYPADKPLPVDRDLRPFSPPELAAMQVPQLVFAAGLGGFGCVVVGVMQLLHLLPAFRLP